MIRPSKIYNVKVSHIQTLERNEIIVMKIKTTKTTTKNDNYQREKFAIVSLLDELNKFPLAMNLKEKHHSPIEPVKQTILIPQTSRMHSSN